MPNRIIKREELISIHSSIIPYYDEGLRMLKYVYVCTPFAAAAGRLYVMLCSHDFGAHYLTHDSDSLSYCWYGYGEDSRRFPDKLNGRRTVKVSRLDT